MTVKPITSIKGNIYQLDDESVNMSIDKNTGNVSLGACKC